MNNKLLLGLLGCIFCGHAAAQSNVAIYGVLDEFVEYSDVGSHNVKRVGSSGLWGSRLGFKGSEDLGDGSKANFILESGLNPDTGTNADSSRFFNRQAWVSLSNAKLGEVRLGRQTSPLFFSEGQIDAFWGASIASGLNNLSLYAVRQDKTVGYLSPSFLGGVSADLYYSASTTGAGLTGKSYQGALRYVNGPLYLATNYQVVNINPAGTDRLKASYTGGHYTVDNFTYYLAFHTAKLEGQKVDRQVISASAKWFAWPTASISLGYTYLRDKSGQKNNAQDVGVLYQYLISKRTTLYAAASYIDNRNAAAFTLSGAAIAGAPLSEPGVNPKGLQLGVTHFF